MAEEEKESLPYSFTQEEFLDFEKHVDPFETTNLHAAILESYTKGDITLSATVELITKDCKNKWDLYVAVTDLIIGIEYKRRLDEDPIRMLAKLLQKK